MSDYTPTTEAVLREWLHAGRMSGEFHRWLDEVKAQAWEEGYIAGEGDGHTGITAEINPYRQGEEQ